MNEIPKVVFSKSLKHVDWDKSCVVKGNLTDETNQLKHEAGKDILVHGGAHFVQSLSSLNLIDEYRLIVHPVTLTNGLPLFDRTMNLEFFEFKTIPLWRSGAFL